MCHIGSHSEAIGVETYEDMHADSKCSFLAMNCFEVLRNWTTTEYGEGKGVVADM